MHRNHSEEVAVNAARKRIASLLNRTLKQLRTDPGPEELDQLATLIDRLPLSAGEQAKCRRSIANAERYAAAGEIGAAKWELRSLSSLRSHD